MMISSTTNSHPLHDPDKAYQGLLWFRKLLLYHGKSCADYIAHPHPKISNMQLSIAIPAKKNILNLHFTNFTTDRSFLKTLKIVKTQIRK